MSDKSKREKLVSEYKELLRQARESTTRKDEEYFLKLAGEKFDEIRIIQCGGDRNIGRFSTF
jgi:hypothetical protein